MRCGRDRLRNRFFRSRCDIVFRISAALAVLATIAACAAAPQPLSFPERMELESLDLALRAVSSPDGSFSTKITGRLFRPMVSVDGDEGVTALIDIGSGTPVECTIFRRDLDLAAAMVEFSERGFAKVAQHSGPVLHRQTHALSSGVVAGAPTFSLSWRYKVASGMGLIKHRIASVSGRGLYCRHIEVGYTKTFAKLFNAMVRAFESSDSGTGEALYSAVLRTKLHERPRGIERQVIHRLEDDSLRIETRTSVLVASLYGQLRGVDTVFVRFARPDGSLIHAVYARSENGELVTNLSLEPRNGIWSISGTRDRVEFQHDVKGSGNPVSTLEENRLLREAIRDQGSNGTSEVRGWYPQIEPTRLLKRTTVLGPRRDADHFHAIAKVGPVVIESVIDTRGETTWSRWLDPRVGELESELLFSKGEP